MEEDLHLLEKHLALNPPPFIISNKNTMQIGVLHLVDMWTKGGKGML